MNQIVFENGMIFNSIEYPVETEPCIFDKKSDISQVYREVLRITVAATYADVAANFVEDAKFAIRQFDIDENGDELETYIDFPKHDYCVAGDIVDHRDGRITIYMGKKTAHELEMDALEEENAELLFSNLTGEDFSNYDDEPTESMNTETVDPVDGETTTEGDN